MLKVAASSTLDGPGQNNLNASTNSLLSIRWTDLSQRSDTITALETNCETWRCFAQNITELERRTTFW